MDKIQKHLRWAVAKRRDSDLITHLMRLRGIKNKEVFLNPKYPDELHDPYLMKGMDKAVSRLVAAVKSGETIGVFADYDADGTPGAALFLDGLRQLGLVVTCYTPTRTEGYGLSKDGLLALHEAGTKVVVTIDLGIAAGKVADYAKELGLDLIITDHHVYQKDVYPKSAFSVIDPKQPGCRYPFKELAGAAVAWKLLSAFLDKLATEAPQYLNGRNPEAIKRWALDLVAIATVADMVPLIDENRLLATYGLKVLTQTRRLGLKALCATAGVELKNIQASTIAFQIAPRINSPMRLSALKFEGKGVIKPQVLLSLALLLSENSAEADQLAGELNQMNTVRQSQIDDILALALARIEAEGLAQKKVIMLSGEDWPKGVLGLVAARVMEKYSRPTIILSLSGDEASGSARSIEGFHLVDALEQNRKILTTFGGHARAAGLALEKKYLEILYDSLLGYADSNLTEEHLERRLDLDAELKADDLKQKTAENILKLAPFGIGNPRPLFLISEVRILSSRAVGASGRHIKLCLSVPGGATAGYSAIGFNFSDRLSALGDVETFDLACELDLNHWQGNTSLDLKLVDIRRHSF